MENVSPSSHKNLKVFVLLLGFMIQWPCSVLRAQTICDSNACFSASINDSPFEFRQDWPFTANLIEQQGTLDGIRPRRTIINIMLEGNSYSTTAGNWFNEGIQFEIAYNGQMPDSTTLCSVELQYKGVVYSFIKGLGKLNAIQFTWNSDHKSFVISADFNFVMRSWGYPQNGKEDVRLTGSFNHVTIAVPGWITAKN